MASSKNGPTGRASLACVTCRRRKVKCSGDWPSCKACIRRSDECKYTGTPPEATKETVFPSAEEGFSDLPSSDVLVKAAEVFFAHYGEFPLWFFRKHTFIEAVLNNEVPVCLLLCILSLVARFVDPCYHRYGGTIEASEHFAIRARKEMSSMYDDISLLNIHCNLITAVYELGRGNEHRAWFLLGLSNRLCQVMGLAYESSYESDDLVTAEIKRRTFWSAYVLERLLVNGGDRPLLVQSQPVTTFFPISTADFTIGRASITSTLHHRPMTFENLPSMMIRIVDLLARIVDWGSAGTGGRHMDARLPWLQDMPFSQFQRELQEWNSSLPSYLAFSEANIKAHIAGAEGNLFGLTHVLYMTAGARLHRKYLPFIPPASYDPAEGPCDGPELIPGPDSPGFWVESTRRGIEFAQGTTLALRKLEEHHIDPWISPFAGDPLLVSSSFHVFCVHSRWRSCEDFTGDRASNFLTYNLRSLINMQESWPVAAFWVKSLRLFYERVSLAQNQLPDTSAPNKPPVYTVKEAMLHLDRSDREKEGLPTYLPLPEHDLFALLGHDPLVALGGLDSPPSRPSSTSPMHTF